MCVGDDDCLDVARRKPQFRQSADQAATIRSHGQVRAGIDKDPAAALLQQHGVKLERKLALREVSGAQDGIKFSLLGIPCIDPDVPGDRAIADDRGSDVADVGPVCARVNACGDGNPTRRLWSLCSGAAHTEPRDGPDACSGEE
jgi:hypothetical protein